MSSSVLKAGVSQLVSINSHSVRQQGVSKIFSAASCILYLGRNYVVPARVLLDTVIDIFRYPASAVAAQNNRSDLEMELKSIHLGSVCPTFYITTESWKSLFNGGCSVYDCNELLTM